MGSVAWAAPVSADQRPEPAGPTIVEWSDRGPEHPVQAVLDGTDSRGHGAGARPVMPTYSAPAASPTPIPAAHTASEPAGAAAGELTSSPVEPTLSSTIRLGTHGAITPRDPADDFTIEAAAVGMIAAGALLAAFAWVRLRGRPYRR